jgi:hypothetical protein
MMLVNWLNNISEGWQIFFCGILLSPILVTISFLFKANRDFFKLLDEFQGKLPPSYKKAKEDLEIIPYSKLKVINTSEMSMNLTTQEIDLFIKKLEIFRYNRIIFKRKQIQSYSNNLIRIMRTSTWEKFGIATIQNLLEDETHEKNKPYLFGIRIGRIIGF